MSKGFPAWFPDRFIPRKGKITRVELTKSTMLAWNMVLKALEKIDIRQSSEHIRCIQKDVVGYPIHRTTINESGQSFQAWQRIIEIEALMKIDGKVQKIHARAFIFQYAFKEGKAGKKWHPARVEVVTPENKRWFLFSDFDLDGAIERMGFVQA